MSPAANGIAIRALCAGTLAILLLGAPPAIPGSEGLLPPDRAFQTKAERIGTDRVRIDWRIAKGYYLYRDRIAIRVRSPKGASVAVRHLSRGDRERDALSGEWRRVLRKEAVLTARLEGLDGDSPVRIEIRYQGCAEDRLCYPLQRRIHTLPSGQPT